MSKLKIDNLFFMKNERKHTIGIFDSGFGGLTILKEIKKKLPEYSYIYLGDNARAPYGTRSFETVYKYTLEAVKKLFELDCELIIIACNTASAKALRSIQQNDLKAIGGTKKVLGILRPCTEQAQNFTTNNNLGIFATKGTVLSQSYEIEISKFFPQITVTSNACPMWVPLVENGEAESDGADFFIKKEINNILTKNSNIDSILLGCTHYPLLQNKIRKFLPQHISIINQGNIVANSLSNYLEKHPEIEEKLIKNNSITYYTTDCNENFDKIGSSFMQENIISRKLAL